ncbi:molybdenum cofactor biosynthesis protein [Candidatus Bathyarchaeota archaeon]|nr:molybdenum cofactor biosynthesis protein [Candidatus Bathyarchaeota archaeon]MBS7630809.1 molybdenum cofactor biosynthesis protein [Candidatus Bathyarchaeota archaeon]
MKPFRSLIPRAEAMNIISSSITPIERVESILLEDSYGRIIAEDVIATFHVPPFDRSAMDGYAVKAQDTYGASNFSPKKLKFVGVKHAGECFEGEVGPGECVQVATGSPMPRGADAVIMVEDTKKVDDYVEAYHPVYPGANVSFKGEDIKKGDIAVRSGEHLSPGKIGAIVALGISSVKVYAKPIVSIISTGSEVKSLGSKLKPGEVYDINSYTLTAIVSANGCIPKNEGIIPDDPEALREALRRAVQNDVIVISGGSSVGTRDLLYDLVEEMGEVKFHGVHVKPGKPTLFGVINEKPVFCMPGNPTSCLSNAYIFLIPALRKIARLPEAEPRTVKAKIGARIVASSGREQFLTVKIENGIAYPVFKKSGTITSMTNAEGYMILPINIDTIEEGEDVEITLLE